MSVRGFGRGLAVTLLLAVGGAASSASAYVIGTTTPGKWGSPVFGTGATVTWSLMPSRRIVDGSESSPVALSRALSTFMPVGFKGEIEAAFDAWSAVADLTFVEMPDPGSHIVFGDARTVDIRIAGHRMDGASGTLAHTFFPPENLGAAAGDLHFDIAENWVIGFDGPGIDIFQVAAHEIGHAIGLGHELDELALMNPFYSEDFRGLQPDDIAGAQFLYGARGAVASAGTGALGAGGFGAAAPIVTPVPPTLVLLAGALALLGGVGCRRRCAPG